MSIKILEEEIAANKARMRACGKDIEEHYSKIAMLKEDKKHLVEEIREANLELEQARRNEGQKEGHDE